MKRHVHVLGFSLLVHGLCVASIWCLIAFSPRTAESVQFLDLSLLPSSAPAPAPQPAAAPRVAAAKPVPARPPTPRPQPPAEPVKLLPSAPPETAAVPPPPTAPPAVPAAAAPVPAAPTAAPVAESAPIAPTTPAATLIAESAPAAVATTIAAESGSDTLSATDYSRISDCLRRQVAYPYRARRQGWEGKVVVAFVLKADGDVEDVKVSSSSGHELLDASAVAAVRKAAPFPSIGRAARLVFPVTYKLR